MLCLEPGHGLFLKLGNDDRIPCHLGPTGALRVPILAFTPEKLRYLTRDLEMLSKEEFEILSIDRTNSTVVSEFKPDSDPRSSTTSTHVCDRHHGGQPRQETEKRPPLRLPGSLEVPDSSSSAADHAPHTRPGELAEAQTRSGGDQLTLPAATVIGAVWRSR